MLKACPFRFMNFADVLLGIVVAAAVQIVGILLITSYLSFPHQRRELIAAKPKQWRLAAA